MVGGTGKCLSEPQSPSFGGDVVQATPARLSGAAKRQQGCGTDSAHTAYRTGSSGNAKMCPLCRQGDCISPDGHYQAVVRSDSSHAVLSESSSYRQWQMIVSEGMHVKA